MYTQTTDRVFCFSSLCFNQGPRIFIPNDGFNDCAHLSIAMRSHESSNSHVKFYQKWIEAKSRLNGGNTTDKLEQLLIKKDQGARKKVLSD
jgi:hypothetical protein